MAQLIKLHDYISRYETDIYRYPSRFVRLKKERWERIVAEWTIKQELRDITSSLSSKQENKQIEKPSNHRIVPNKLKQFFLRRKNKSFNIDNRNLFSNDDEQFPFYKEMPMLKNYETKEQLKYAFKEEVFNFQINWASSTISEKSDVKKKYYFDPMLSFFLKELPDSYFVMYEPVIYLKKAPVDFDTIILTPNEIWIIASLLGTEETIYEELTEKYWLKHHRGDKEKILHPGVFIRRMRSVIEHILLENDLSFSVRTAILAKDSYIDIPRAKQRINHIDRRNFPYWQEKMVRNVAPIKHQQLKIADVLLQQSLTISRPRARSVLETELQ